MSVTPQVTYPGVYVVEVPSGVRTITGVATSITAFVGYTQRGPTNKAVQIFNFGDYERQFGGLSKDSNLSYAVQQFFLNGGTNAWVVRVAKGAAKAAVTLKNAVSAGTDVLDVTASSEGIWGNMLRLDVNYDTANPASLFNLTVTEFEDAGGTLQAISTEVHRNLSMNSSSARFAPDVINAESELIQVSRPGPATTALTGKQGTSTSGDLEPDDLTKLDNDHRRLAITLDGDGPYEFDLFDPGSATSVNTSLGDLTTAIQAGVIVKKPLVTAFSDFKCTAGVKKIIATSGSFGEKSSVRFSNASIRNAAAILKLGVTNGGREVEAAAAIRPAQTGTTGSRLDTLDLTTLSTTANVNATIQLEGATDDLPHQLTLWTTKPTTLEELRSKITNALAAETKAQFNQAQVSIIDSSLRVVAGGTNPNIRIHFTDSGDPTATTIGLTTNSAPSVIENVTKYALGSGLSSQAQGQITAGDDGSVPDIVDIEGDRQAKKGMYALEDVDLFNILCFPNVSDSSVLSEALSYVNERRAFLLMDFPSTVNSIVEAKQWLATNATLRHKNAAIYFPRIQAPDPLEEFRVRSFPTCGAVAGQYAQTDATRGVWKAPAGIDVVLRGVTKLDYTLTDPENGVLNPLAINCLRTFPVYGSIIWGARTLDGTDALASEWKYVPVRRLALFLEESLYRGTKWVVFEPNDEPLWAQIRLNVGAFMHSLFRQGAFQGTTPREAYFVKCDKETTTQDDINHGIVNILVGFAPLKPAEFVILRISQIAGQIQT